MFFRTTCHNAIQEKEIWISEFSWKQHTVDVSAEQPKSAIFILDFFLKVVSLPFSFPANFLLNFQLSEWYRWNSV